MGAAGAAFFVAGGGRGAHQTTQSQTTSQPIQPIGSCDGLVILGGVVLAVFIVSALLIWIAVRFGKR
jgi:hypothetical protein